MTLLDMVPFFNDFSRNFKIKLLYNMEVIDVFRNQTIYSEGSACQDLYFIIRGEFEISKQISVIMESGIPKLKLAGLTDIHNPFR